ncbi:MAG TPA: thioredoxin-dependent thiol peroxidase [Bacteroidetes bacterium]|nr:thioredoxin-dependent thiol peroxidase [Bacteroidota bacterium]
MTHLIVGDKAPYFETFNHRGEKLTLTGYKGKKIVLYFYPKDSTPGCTMQACNLRDNFEHLSNKGFVIFGVSNDSEKSHNKFIEKHDLPFDLLMDEDKKIVNLFGIYGLKKFMGREYNGIHRTTFIIDENGIITDIIEKVKTKDHTSQIIK